MITINDVNYRQHISPIVDGQRRGRGFLGRNPTPRFRRPFSDLGIPRIPESEWDDRIEEIESQQATLRQLCEGMGLDCLSQGQTNYCWVNAPTMVCMILRLQESGQVVRLSPASAGAPIKGFQNRGGWGSEALEYFRTNGLNLQSDWPANAIDRKYYTDANKAKAKLNRTLEWFDLGEGREGWINTASTILAGIPVALGYNWWSHEVTGVGIKKGSHDLLILNSWGTSWSENGYAWLATDSKKIPNDATCTTGMMAI